MPYIGLLDDNGHEINGPGYYRLDMSAFKWGISPPPRTKPEAHMAFVNLDHMQFPNAMVTCRVWGMALYDDVDNPIPFYCSPIPGGPVTLINGGPIGMGPGVICFDMRMISAGIRPHLPTE